MESYKTIRNFGLAMIVASMPYVCNSCDYSQNKRLEAKEIAEISDISDTLEITNTVETILK